MSNSFDVTNIAGVLRAPITRVICFDLTVSNLLVFGSFESCNLRFGKDNSFLFDLG